MKKYLKGERMRILNQQFVSKYEISGGTIRIQNGGEFTNDRGEKIAYPCSVKITSVNTIEGDINPQTNFPDTVQNTCVFKIPCENMIEAGEVARSISPLLEKKSACLFDWQVGYS